MNNIISYEALFESASGIYNMNTITDSMYTIVINEAENSSVNTFKEKMKKVFETVIKILKNIKDAIILAFRKAGEKIKSLFDNRKIAETKEEKVNAMKKTSDKKESKDNEKEPVDVTINSEKWVTSGIILKQLFTDEVKQKADTVYNIIYKDLQQDAHLGSMGYSKKIPAMYDVLERSAYRYQTKLSDENSFTKTAEKLENLDAEKDINDLKEKYLMKDGTEITDSLYKDLVKLYKEGKTEYYKLSNNIDKFTSSLNKQIKEYEKALKNLDLIEVKNTISSSNDVEIDDLYKSRALIIQVCRLTKDASIYIENLYSNYLVLLSQHVASLSKIVTYTDANNK